MRSFYLNIYMEVIIDVSDVQLIYICSYLFTSISA